MRATLRQLIEPGAFGVIATIAGTVIASHYFPASLKMATCALVAIGLASYLHELLERNRVAIWEVRTSPVSANRLLASELIAIFLGVFLSVFVTAFFLRRGIAVSTELNFSNGFIELLFHNAKVLAISLGLAFLYRAGGLVLILAWNAYDWAETYTSIFAATLESSGTAMAALLAVGVTPHLLLEVSAYVVGGMSGVFFSKAVLKYDLQTTEFKQVSTACVRLFVGSVALLIVAAICETILAQPIYTLVHGSL